MSEGYNKYKDQPVQIDCRIKSCTFQAAGKCNKISPAITLNENNSFVCWSMETDEAYVKNLLSTCSYTSVKVKVEDDLMEVIDILGEINYINVKQIGAIIDSAGMEGASCSIVNINNERIWLKATPVELHKQIERWKNE